MRKRYNIFFSYLIVVFLSAAVTSSADSDKNYFSVNFPDIYSRAQLQSQGDRLVEEGRFLEAIEKYRQALDPKYIKYENDKISAVGSITEVFILIGDYDAAFREWQWFLSQSLKNARRRGESSNDEAQLKAQEIMALKEYRDTGNAQVVYDFLGIYKKKKYKSLPPSFEWGAGPTEVATLLRLYDKIGDYDAGIKLIDECLDFLSINQAQFGENAKLYKTIKTSAEATQCAELDKKERKRNRNWRSCNLIREHLLVREAFEAEKKSGGPTCRNQPLAQGQYCLGDATKAIVQSDYFPW